DDEGTAVRVLVQNLEFGGADAGEVVRTVRDEHVDLLLTVETTPEAVEGFRAAGLTASLPHESLDPAPQAAGVAVWSRYPLTPPERVPGFGLGVLRTEMAGPHGPGTVVAAHPVAPVFNATWDHTRFRSLRALGYTDSVSGGGDGWVPTWPADRSFPPLIGIDHVMARGAVGVGETSTVRISGTDHLGVLATVRVPPARAG